MLGTLNVAAPRSERASERETENGKGKTGNASVRRNVARARARVLRNIAAVMYVRRDAPPSAIKMPSCVVMRQRSEEKRRARRGASSIPRWSIRGRASLKRRAVCNPSARIAADRASLEIEDARSCSH